ncbi:MAG TPA: hypothetical protein VHR86_04020 [Armatimonadota bacterium]|nr:hypothetical protein [Armatimonadota bacterium]
MRNQTAMSNLSKHVLLPSLAPLALIGLYFTPKAVFGCANRGILALCVALFAAIGALAATARGTAERRRGSDTYAWWLVTTLILLLPTVLLFGPLR